MRHLVLVLLCIPLPGVEMADLEKEAAAIPVEFVRIFDPAGIVLQLADGRKIETSYGGIEFDVIYAWEQELKKSKRKRPMTLTYTVKCGVEAKDDRTGTVFQLIGAMEPHPIDLAVHELIRGDDLSTIDIVNIHKLAKQAWDAELNRICQRLGGAENETLRDAQRTWIAFREAQETFLFDHYGKMEGTIWKIVCARHVARIPKDRAQFLLRVSEW